MSRLGRKVAAAGVLAVLCAAGTAPAFSASLGTGAAALAAPATAPTTLVRCWNCNTGAAVGVGIAAGILGGAAIASAMAPPPVMYAPPPPPPPPYAVIAPSYPPPVAYYPPPPPQPYYRPARCFYQTDPMGGGYWGPC